MTSSQPVFLAQLQHQATQQAKLYRYRVLPPQLDALTSFIGRYPWQVLLIVSGLVAVVVEVLR